jgi:hypothetical protein
MERKSGASKLVAAIVILVGTLAGCSSDEQTPAPTRGACMEPVKEEIRICGVYEDPRGVDVWEESCVKRNGTWMEDCPAGALGLCRAVQGVNVQTVHVYENAVLFHDAEDVRKFCENSGATYVPVP